MTPEHVNTHLSLEFNVQRAREELEIFDKRRRELAPGVDGLTPAERLERLSALIKGQVMHPHAWQARGLRRGRGERFYGETPFRVVETAGGERYVVNMLVEDIKDGTFKEPHLHISAKWRNVTNNSNYFDASYREDVDSSWTQTNPDHVQGLKNLTDLEWTFEAYISGTPLEEG